MRFLGFDLAWNGPTGWIYWDDDKDDPICNYGEFQPKINGKLSGTERQKEVCWQLFELTKTIIDTVKTEEDFLVVVEQSDWFQNITGKADWKKLYSQERTVQRSLGMAEASLFLAAKMANVKIYGIGAREAKQEFGALRKDSAARIICEEHPRFLIKEIINPGDYGKDFLFGSDKDGCFVVCDKITGNFVPHHVSDAIVITQVVSRRLRAGQ